MVEGVDALRRAMAVVLIAGGILAAGGSVWGQTDGASMETVTVGLVGVALIVLGVWLWKNQISA